LPSQRAQARQLFEALGAALLYHHHLDSGVANPTPASQARTEWLEKHWSDNELQLHRLVYQSLAVLLIKLLRGVLPVDQVQCVCVCVCV